MDKKLQTVDYVKWSGTVVQLIGYGLTGFGLTTWNVYFFIVGIFLWMTVGFLWRDNAIILVHVGALISILVGIALGR